MVCHPGLAGIADSKAKEMASLQKVTHLGKSSANRRLKDSGYPLSKIYPNLLENNVEAIAGGISKAEDVWQAFKNSEAHRMHLLGEHDIYLLQNEIGVGYFEDPFSAHVEYWVIYVAHRDGDTAYAGVIARSKD